MLPDGLFVRPQFQELNSEWVLSSVCHCNHVLTFLNFTLGVTRLSHALRCMGDQLPVDDQFDLSRAKCRPAGKAESYNNTAWHTS